jgi:hypothetical protein
MMKQETKVWRRDGEEIFGNLKNWRIGDWELMR